MSETQKRSVDVSLLAELVRDLGEFGKARLEIGARVSRSSIRDMFQGKTPGPVVRKKVAAFLELDEDALFPLHASGRGAA